MKGSWKVLDTDKIIKYENIDISVSKLFLIAVPSGAQSQSVIKNSGAWTSMPRSGYPPLGVNGHTRVCTLFIFNVHTRTWISTIRRGCPRLGVNVLAQGFFMTD